MARLRQTESAGSRVTPLARLLGLALCLAAAGSCNSGVREGRAPSFLIVEALEAAQGGDPDTFGGTLASDVLTCVDQEGALASIFCPAGRTPTIFEDVGRVTLRLGLKDPGTPTNPTGPTSANFITVTRYRVTFIRADGRNRPGVDVPHPFDGAVTFTVSDSTQAGFTIVRAQAKQEAPLQALTGNGGAQHISTIAEVSFFGHDQTGREVTVTGRISVNFADWGDPE